MIWAETDPRWRPFAEGLAAAVGRKALTPAEAVAVARRIAPGRAAVDVLAAAEGLGLLVFADGRWRRGEGEAPAVAFGARQAGRDCGACVGLGFG